jgi:hypothetical protein
VVERSDTTGTRSKKTAHPAEGWQRFCHHASGCLWHSLPGCRPGGGSGFRRCRFARPPATTSDASGISAHTDERAGQFPAQGKEHACAGEYGNAVQGTGNTGTPLTGRVSPAGMAVRLGLLAGGGQPGGSFPAGTKVVAGGRAKRYHRDTVQKDSPPRRGVAEVLSPRLGLSLALPAGVPPRGGLGFPAVSLRSTAGYHLRCLRHLSAHRRARRAVPSAGQGTCVRR